MNLLAPLLHGTDAEEIFSAERQLREMVRFEVALAYALEAAGIAPAGTGNACEGASGGFPSQDQANAIAQGARQSGNIAIPFVKLLTQHLRERAGSAADYVHFGVTSQDVLDTALVLQLREVCALTERQVRRISVALVDLIQRHGDTLLAGRTWLQQGPPIPFGLKAAQWLSAMLRHMERMKTVGRRIAVVQFGGAVGTLASLDSRGLVVARELARRLELHVPDVPWHSERDTLAEFATTLALLDGTLGKIARDLSLMLQTEVSEVQIEAAPGTGGSSTMPHKCNPVSIAVVLSAAVRAPGLAATMLAAMVQEHERGLGGWQAEWEALPDLCRITCGALDCMATTLEALRIDAGAMRRNLQMLGGVALAEAVSMKLSGAIGRPAAHEVLERASRAALERDVELAEILRQEPEVTKHLSGEEIEAALNAELYVGASAIFVQQVLEEAAEVLPEGTSNAVR